MIWRLAITVGKPTISDGTETCLQQAMKGGLVMLVDEPTISDGTETCHRQAMKGGLVMLVDEPTTILDGTTVLGVGVQRGCCMV